MNQKLKSLGEATLRDFTIDARSSSLYKFEGEDYRLVISVMGFSCNQISIIDLFIFLIEKSKKFYLKIIGLSFQNVNGKQ